MGVNKRPKFGKWLTRQDKRKDVRNAAGALFTITERQTEAYQIMLGAEWTGKNCLCERLWESMGFQKSCIGARANEQTVW